MPQGKHADAPLNYGSKIIQGSSRLWSIHYLFIHFKYLFIYFAPQISRLRLQYEEKMKGLMPASLREVKFYCLCLLMGKLPSRVFVHRKLYSFSLRDIPLHATCSDRPNWGPKGRTKKKRDWGSPYLRVWCSDPFSNSPNLFSKEMHTNSANWSLYRYWSLKG